MKMSETGKTAHHKANTIDFTVIEKQEMLPHGMQKQKETNMMN